MTVAGWILALGLFGIAFALWHFERALVAARRVRREHATDPMMVWVARGDFWMWGAIVLLAILFLLVDATPIINPSLAALVSGSAYIALHSLFVIGMALLRFHAMRQPAGN